ncbi:MAG: peptidase M16 [Micavibrio sp.]|nr:MAG: peptidase M16 [Micavibrio sp.]
MRTALFFILIVIFILPAPLHARDKVLDIQEVTSPGGIKAWLVEDHSIPIIALKFSFKGAGAALDPADKQGLSRLVSNTMDEGAGDLDSQAFQKELRDLSIGLSFGSGRDNFGGNLKTLTRNKERAFELMHLALTEPRFDPEPVGRMIASNQSRIRSSLSDPDWMAVRLLNDMAFENHPYALNSGGTLSTLQSITVIDLENFGKFRLGKNNLKISVAGDITPEELATTLDNIFGDLPDVSLTSPPDLETQNQGQIALYERDIPQTVIEMIQPGIARTDPDFHTAQIMNYVLGGSGFGSRLMEEVREKRGLAYGIYSGFYLSDHFKGFSVSTSTANTSVKQVLDIIKAEWTKMLNNPVSQEEIDNAKSYLIGSLPLSLTSTDSIASLLLSIQADDLPIDYLEQRNKNIGAASAEDIARVTKRILAPEKFVTVLVGKPEGIAATKTYETLPNVE